jgi:hypothetical protein
MKIKESHCLDVDDDLDLLYPFITEDRKSLDFSKSEIIARAAGWLEEVVNMVEKKEKENLGIKSIVELEDGSARHIPMIDFCCPCSPKNEQKIVRILSFLKQDKGFLLESGNSYHYYGIRLLTEAEWQVFMGQLRMINIVGRIWPSLQLRQNFSVLRVSISLVKPVLPKVIAKIGNF